MNTPTVRSVEIFTTIPSLVGVMGAVADPLSDQGCVRVVMTVAPNDYTGDETEMSIILDDIDNDVEGVRCFDTRIKIHNGDWASLRDQQEMIASGLDAFYSMGLNKSFGHLSGE